MELINNRKSVRVYEDREIPATIKDEIIKAAMRAPTAGNMMLYSIIDVTDNKIKEKLSVTCDNQGFIAKAPLVLIFMADYQKWYDYYIYSGAENASKEGNTKLRKPQEGDFLLAVSDALISAQNAVIAAESMGIGSCYIGDIMEKYEIHKEMFSLPKYVFPVGMLCFGYPTTQQKERPFRERFDKEFVVFENRYNRLEEKDLKEMFKNKKYPKEYGNFGKFMYERKFNTSFSEEMTRSVRKMLENWR